METWLIKAREQLMETKPKKVETKAEIKSK